MSFFNQQVQALDSILTRLRCYRDAQRIRTDCMDLLKNIPSLSPRSGALARTTQSHIMYLAGTIPIYYGGSQYNIPVAIWLVEAYPFSPPVCYVTPTPEMIIKPKHKHVDSAGMCYLPYLSSWNPNTCNLMGLVAAMAKVFGEDPPVRSQKPAPTTTTSTPPTQPTQPNYPPPNQYPPYSTPPQYPPSTSNPPYPPPTTNPVGPYSYPNPSPYPPQPYPPQPDYGNPYSSPANPPSLPPKPASTVIPPAQVTPPGQPFENPAEVAKRNAVRAVTDKIQANLHEFNVKTTREIDDLIVQNAEMDARGKSLEQEKERNAGQLGQMDTEVEDLTKKFEDISKWLAGYDTDKFDIDFVTEPKEPLSKQLLDLVAEDATIEDTLYYLEKTLGNGDLNVEAFLKAVRSLSTEQFMKRATIKRIHEKQRGL